ncbi:MAG TPA: histidine kinase [Gaiellaceae bacterium]|nr:histidine kinase [Gaiellaceae bacterium]
MNVRQDGRDDFQAWLWGEILLFGLLGSSLALFLSNTDLQTRFSLPQLGLVLQTVMTLAGGLIALLAGIRFAVEGRRLDLLLCTGFFVLSLSIGAFGVAPLVGGQPLHRSEAWAGVIGRLLGWALVAAAPFVRGRSGPRALANTIVAASLALGFIWFALRSSAGTLPPIDPHSETPGLLTGSLAAQALLNLLGVVGFGKRFYERREDLDRWLALGSTLMLFASLHYVFTPVLAAGSVSRGDALRLLAYGLLLAGAWRAISFAEFGRAVAEERARVAREIHDGLAQYLFAVSTHATMLQRGAPQEETLAKLKEAADAAQQEARFAILALSTAAGNAPFDAALRRYIEFLTADGELEVDLEIDPNVRLAPDEQIEVFRIVQEGLGNVRKHANARRAEVVIGLREEERFVSVRDDGDGFDGESAAAGQGLKNIRARTKTIEGGFTLTSKPGRGTALEVVLRT